MRFKSGQHVHQTTFDLGLHCPNRSVSQKIATIGEITLFFVRKKLTLERDRNVVEGGAVIDIQEGLTMNDLIVFAGVGILLIGLPVLVARFRAQKH